MTTLRIPRAGALLAILLSLAVTGVAAAPPGMDGARGDGPRDAPRVDRPRADDPRRVAPGPDGGRRDDARRSDPGRSEGRRDEGRRDGPPPRLEPGYKFDSRYRHDRYYPPRGHVVDRLPSHPIVIPHHDTRFYFHGGVWYRPDGPRFVVVAPPFGLGISVLPPYYTTLWVGGVPYYYADEVYYNWRPERREYVVVEPPREAEAYVPPTTPETLFVYPKQGQDEQLIATDRYECHRWAVDQTGFDPVQPAADMPAAQLEVKRADYQRATKACLEARGYSVR